MGAAVDLRELRTERLVLRRWRDADRAPFAELNADRRVMAHMPSPLTRTESDALAARIDGGFAREGLGLWALELPGVAPFIGFTGLSIPGFCAPFTPCVEVGWRLARAHWGAGYATEAARGAIQDGFARLGLAEIVSFTASGNERSRRVMERLGMRRAAAEDFDHPRLGPEHPLARHVLYRLSREEWTRNETGTSRVHGEG